MLPLLQAEQGKGNMIKIILHVVREFEFFLRGERDFCIVLYFYVQAK